MPDPENPSVTAPATPEGAAPATPAFDFEAFKASLATEFEQKMSERISGLQSVYDKKLNERDEQIRQLKTATLSEEEREQLAEKEATEYVEKMERELWLAREASQKFPKAAPLLQKLFEANGDVESFAQSLEAVLNPAPVTPEPEEEVSEVDPNNPPRTPVAGANDFIGPDGQVYTPELRRQILESLSGTTLAQLRAGRQ